MLFKERVCKEKKITPEKVAVQNEGRHKIIIGYVYFFCRLLSPLHKSLFVQK